MNNAPSRMLPWHLKMCDWLENIINKHPKLFFFTLRWWNQSSKNIKLRRTESSHVSSCRLPVLTLSSLVVPNRLVHHNQPCDFYAIYTLLYVQLITLSTQLTPFYMCLDPLSVHFLVWPEGRYVAHDICSVYTRPPSRNTNTSLTTRLLSGPRGEQTAVTVCVESPVTQRHLRHKGMMVSDRCRGGRGKKAPEWQARTGSQLLWRQLGRQAHTEPTRRGKWLNTPRTSNDFFFFFYNLKLSFLSPHNSNAVTAI